MKKVILMFMAIIATVSMYAQDVHVGKLFDNSYLQFGVGLTTKTNEFNDGKNRPMFSLEYGKDLTPLYGTSIGIKTTINNLSPKSKVAFDDVSLVWNHKLDLISVFSGYNPERKWNLKAVGSLGFTHTNGSVTENWLVAEVGPELSYNLSKHFDIVCRPMFIWNDIDKGLDKNRSEVELTIGTRWKIGKKFEKCNNDVTLAEIEVINNEVNKLKNDNELQKQKLTEQEGVIKEQQDSISKLNNRQVETKTNVIVPTVIGFEIGKSDISSVQKANLITLANTLKENKEFNITVVGHADAQTGTKERNKELSIERAESVKSVLVELGVESDRIKTVGKGDTEQVFKEDNDLNRAVITIVK